MGSTDVEIIILGCGGSGGTPLVGNHWGNCDPSEPKNTRTRASIAIHTARTCVVIDTGPDFRTQINREDIGNIDAVIYSHAHADHIHGFDDVRYASIKRRINGEDDYMIPIYAQKNTLNDIKAIFPYMFKVSDDGLYRPLIQDNELQYSDSLTVGDITIQTFDQIHGAGQSMGFRIGDIGYSTDVSEMTDAGLNALNGIHTWIVDCGQYGANEEDLTVHPNLERVLRWNETVQADKLYLTHLTPRTDYQTTNEETPDYIECSYDGLKLKASLE